MIDITPFTDRDLPNVDLGKTQITDKIRVSSAAIFYQEMFGDYYQLETWIFSDDERQKSRMVIHCTTGREIPQREKDKVSKIHKRIADNLLKIYKDETINSTTSTNRQLP